MNNPSASRYSYGSECEAEGHDVVIKNRLWPHACQRDILAKTELQSLLDALLSSPYLAESDLNEGFSGTRGFSILFRLDQRKRAQELIPELKPYFEKVIKEKANAFFLNPLVIHGGGAVRAHADKTLSSYLPTSPFPFCVSVLYLSLPKPRTGGNIVFHRWFGRHRITPDENLLLEFPGWLKHEVTELRSESEEPRVSLVLEQYQLTPEQLQKLRPWHLDSSRPFDDFLAQAMGTGDKE